MAFTVVLAILGRAGHLDHRPMASRAYERERHLHGRRRGPGARSWTAWTSRRGRQGAASASSRTCARRSCARRSGRRSAPARSTRASTCSARRWRGRSSPGVRSRSRRLGRRRSARARVHGQGERPGPLRADATRPSRRRSRSSRRGASGTIQLAGGRDRTTRPRAGSRSPATKEKIYSRDRNLWHISHEGGPLEDPALRAAGGPVHAHALDPRMRPTRRSTSTIGFEEGYPVAVNGEALAGRARRARSTRSAASTAIGRADIVEDRLVGMKSRGVYETPGGTLLVHGAPRARAARPRPAHARAQG